jgi:hypothetical protein
VKIRLNPEALVVSSFDASPAVDAALLPPDHPTPDTGCFDCPIVFSEPCY